MPRNRYNKVVREIEREQISRQEKELAVIRRKLRGQDAEPTAVPLANEAKERRSTRVEQKQRDKPKGKVRGWQRPEVTGPTETGLGRAAMRIGDQDPQKGAPHD
jgi:hypothetical protein